MNRNHKIQVKRTMAYSMATVLSIMSIAGCSGSGSSLTEDTGARVNEEVTYAVNSHGSEDGKDEMVYVIARADGSVTDTIVSAWLKNPSEAETISDYSVLTDIVNVKGDETYTVDADGNLIWNAAGHDIYYQGKTTQELPISVKITYELDGVEVTPEELAGKSGHLKMTFHYTNNAKKEVEIDGEKTTIYQPFGVISGAMFDNEKVSNLTVTNGKAINDGEHSIVVGMALPGLSESLGLDTLEIDGEPVDIDIPESVEIEADVTDFSLLTTITLVDNNILKNVDMDENGTFSLDSLKDSINELTDAATQLVDGTSELYDGMQELYDGVVALDDGAGDLKTGAEELKNGTGTLDSGASDLKEGAGQLKDGAVALDEGVGTLQEGAGQLDEGAGQLKDGAAALASGAAELKDGVGQLVDQAPALVDGANQVAAGASDLKDGADQVASGAGDLKTGADQLASGAEDLKTGVDQVASGAASLESGAKDLADGVSQINDGAKSLDDGLATLSESVASMPEGTANLLDGVLAIKAGLKSGNTDAPGIYEVASMIAAGAADAAAKLPAVSQGIDSIENGLQTISDDYLDQAAEADGAALQYLQALQASGLTEEQQTLLAQAMGYVQASQQLDEGVAAQLDVASQKADLEHAGALVTGLETIRAGADTLSAGMDQISAGAAGITGGVDTIVADENMGAIIAGLQALNTGSTNLVAGVSQLKAGSSALLAGTTAANTGAGQLSSGATALKNGTDTLAAGASQLSDGAEELAAGAGQLKTGTDTLAAGAGQLSDGAAQLAAGASAVKTGGDALYAGASQLSDGAATLYDGTVSLKAGTGNLVEGVQTLKSGADQLAGGAGTLYDGTVTLKDGTAALLDGAGQLYDGTVTLKDGTGELLDGAKQLLDGAEELRDGMKKFDEEGIQKLADLLNADIGGVVDRFKALRDYANEYTSFSGSAEDADTGVKFLIRTDSIGE